MNIGREHPAPMGYRAVTTRRPWVEEVEAMWKPIRRLFVLLVLLLVAAVAGYLRWLHPGYDERPFTPAAWAAAEAEARGHMVKDLLAKHRLEGMTRAEIVALLGEPDSSHARGSGTYALGYMGGRAGAPFVFPHRLHVTFRDGRVTGCRIDD
jgi:hypothetical protein